MLLGAVPFLAGAWSASQQPVPRVKPVNFAAEILPILKPHCGTCHGSQGPAAGLDLTTAKGLQKGGVSKSTVVPKDPAKSVLLQRLKGLGGKPQMPMGFAPLTKAQIALIERWVVEGASFEGQVKVHWAYLPPVAPMPPKVRNAAWVRNPIDAFVLARLEKEGLKPSPEAPKELLLRRASLDLTGLPPTIEELDVFLADKSPNAYEKAVDRLLASPHYGERQARIWLDLARYADTNGFEADYSRTMWKYRDWVINAYNRNMPFDRFTVEQLAGDLLPNPTIDQLIATGFHRNTMFNSEGGVDKDEAYFEVNLDRVGTTSTVWLGQTLACARCHDHKYDPFSQKEFYQLYALWSNLEYKVEGDHKFGQDKNYEPQIEAPSPEQAAEKKRLASLMSQAEADLDHAKRGAAARVEAWERDARSVRWLELTSTRVETSTKAEVRREDDGSFTVTGPAAAHDTYSVEVELSAGKWTGLRLEVLPDKSLPKNGPGKASSGNFILSKLEVEGVRLGDFGTSFTQDGYGTTGLTDDSGDTGWAVYPKPGVRHVLVAAFTEPIRTADAEKLRLKLTMNSPTWPEHVIGRFRVSFTSADDPSRFAYADEVEQALAATPPSESAAKTLSGYALSVDPNVRTAQKAFEKVKAERDALQAKIPTALILREKKSDGPITTPLHIRGEWLNAGDPVEAGTPAILPPLPAGAKANRLSMAKWLVSPENPLTARVTVNRMWESYFGRGIVETSDNFGTQGSKPTHPQLLDWLATEFVRRKWDMKAIHRLIVTSATYRQSSNATAALLAKDPHNELLARGPRFRMEAEMVRDVALSAAGLLNLKVGGPSVYPSQPEGIWDSPYSGERWMTSSGENANRRGLYTFWKRTAPYPAFMNFDATSREVCTAKRVRTNTPLQALTLMNDPAFLDAARALGSQMEAKPGLKPIQRIELGFRRATSRRPSAAESQALLKLVGATRTLYTKEPERAKKLAGGVEHAVWMVVASTILNLDETITKG